MRKLLYLSTCLLGLARAAQGQNAGLACGNGRYASDLFSALPATTAVFGYNTIRNYYPGSESAPVPLSLDVHEPAGDAAGQRPLVLVAFGGAFVSGARTDAEIVSICQAFARKGYVAAAIDYRLLNTDGASLGAVPADQSKLRILNAGNPLLYSAHGPADSTVPYDCGTIQYTTFTLCGSHQTQLRADTAGIPNQLPPVAGGHGSPVSATNLGPIIDEAAAFFQSTVLCAAGPLAVVLTSFAGRVAPEDCAATLTWQTAAETNSYAYEVQASADGQKFAPLGTVPSQNRAAGASYTYRAGLVAGPRYFRLRLLDSDGTAAYSPVVALVGTCEVAPLLLVPNPVRDYALVSGLPAGRCQLLLYNTAGQRVLRLTAVGSARLILSGLPAGVYLLKVLAEDGAPSSTTRLVKE